MQHRYLPISLFILAGACSETGVTEFDQWAGTIDTLQSGTVVSSNPVDPLWTTSPLMITEDLRLGSADGDGPDVFGQIAAVGMDRRGRLYVLDGQAQEIRVFDASGGFVRTIGRPGAGPGEFRGAIGVAWDADERLWVADVGNARYSVFDTIGNYIESHPRKLVTVRPWVGGFDQRGLLHDVSPRMGSDGTVEYKYYRFDESVAVEDSFPSLSYRVRVVAPFAAAQLIPRLTFAFDRDGYVWFGMTDSYRLYKRTLGGDTVRIIDLSRRPRQVGQAERDSINERIERDGAPPGWRSADLPDLMPFFQRITPDPGGRLWVRTSESETAFDIFDVDGRYLGQARSPVAFSGVPPLVFGDTIVAAAVDAAGVPILVRGHIDPD